MPDLEFEQVKAKVQGSGVRLMNELLVFKTNYWIVSHRSDSQYPGYLIVSSSEETNDFHKLNSESLNELGSVLCATEKLLISVYSPYKVIMSKLGFSKGFSCHFHVLPITESLLQQIVKHPNYTKNEPDGNDAMLFVSREYCEQILEKKQQEIIIQEVIRLRE